MKRVLLALAGSAIVGSTAACGVTRPTAPKLALGGAPRRALEAPALSVTGGVVTIDSHQGGSRALAIEFRRPQASTYSAQAIVHRWVASDVTEYDVTLDVGTAGGMNALATVQVFPKGSQPETEAVFSNLKVGVPYVVSVLARGNVGGVTGSPTRVLNTQVPANALVLFSSYGNNNIDNAKTVSVQVQLDSVAFSGTATVSITTMDGTYSAPPATESGAAD